MPILECQKVTKAYGGLLAVSNLSFAVEPGEIYSIVGPNGAGKTSLFDCISGVNRATSGSIKFKDREIQGLRAHQICRLGLARTFQTTVAFDSQTVLTNVLVGAPSAVRQSTRPFGSRPRHRSTRWTRWPFAGWPTASASWPAS